MKNKVLLIAVFMTSCASIAKQESRLVTISCVTPAGYEVFRGDARELEVYGGFITFIPSRGEFSGNKITTNLPCIWYER